MPPATPAPTLKEVYTDHFDFVRRNGRRLGCPPEGLDDVVQDVFLAVSQNLSHFRGDANLRTWLFAITARVVKHHKRTFARHSRRVEALAEELRHAPSATPGSRCDASMDLVRAMDHLTERQRTIFILSELEGMTAKEVGALVGAKENTIYAHLHQAKKRLEAVLVPSNKHVQLKEAR